MTEVSKRTRESNWLVHLCWTVAFLLLAITALIVYEPDGATIRDYISFASAISSILLAVVAIFYSIVSNEGMSKILSSIGSSADRISQDSKDLSQITFNLSDKIQQLENNVASVPKQIGQFQENIYEKMNEILGRSTIEDSKDIKGNTFFKGPVTLGLSISTYLILYAFKSTKEFIVKDVFKSEALGRYVEASLTVLKCTEYRGIILNREADKIVVNSIGDLDKYDLLTKFEKDDRTIWRNARNDIRIYFGE